VGPDVHHPFVLRNTQLWNNFWAFRPGSPSVLVDGMDIYNGRYGIYRPVYDHHAYGRFTIAQVENPQAFFDGESPKGFNLLGPHEIPRQLSQKEIAQIQAEMARKNALQKVGEQSKGVIAGRSVQPILNPMVVVPGIAEVKASSEAFPAPLEPVDDLPPATVVTQVLIVEPGKMIVRGTTSDGGTVKRVSVNGQDARPVRPNFAEWEVLLPVPNGVVEPIAFAEDTSGNIEKQPHHATNGR
jgi:hypothetical protein